MYFPLLFQVISCGCFISPTIGHSVLHVCPDWPVISTYTLRCLLNLQPRFHTVYSSFCFNPPPPLPPVYYRLRHCLYLSGRRDTFGDFSRCFKCGKFGYWAKDCRSLSWPGSYQPLNYNSFPGISYNKPTLGQSTQPKQ